MNKNADDDDTFAANLKKERAEKPLGVNFIDKDTKQQPAQEVPLHVGYIHNTRFVLEVLRHRRAATSDQLAIWSGLPGDDLDSILVGLRDQGLVVKGNISEGAERPVYRLSEAGINYLNRTSTQAK